MKPEARSPKSEAPNGDAEHATRNTLQPIANPRSPFLRYLSVYGALWRNSLTREMTFKSNFLLWIIVELLWFGLQLAFIGVLYLHTEHIGTWTKWEVVLLIGASHLIQQVFQAFFLVNCTNLSELVRSGKMDFLLLLPVNTRFVVSLRQVDLGSFVNAASAVVVMGYAARQLHLAPSLMQVAGFLEVIGPERIAESLVDRLSGQLKLLGELVLGHVERELEDAERRTVSVDA